MNVKYYSPDPENMFEHAYLPLKLVYDDKETILAVYAYTINKSWVKITHTLEFYKQYLHNHCFRELTDEEVFLANL